MKYVSVAEMIAIEKEADRSGHTYDRMMENAGLGLAQVIHERNRHLQPGPIAGLIGSGNNGGDTLVALAHLSVWGWQTMAYLALPRAADDPLLSRFIEAGGELIDGEFDTDYQQLEHSLRASSILLDGILGTGIKLPLRGKIPDILIAVGQTAADMDVMPTIIAVDCPSGVDCDTGETAAECLHADLTVTMAAVKMGLLKFPAYNYVGVLQPVGIGLPEGLRSWESIQRFAVNDTYVSHHLHPRSLDSHKGTFGTALIIAGSVNYTGAVILAGESAYRVGVGLVILAVPEAIHGILAGNLLEATWLPLPHETGAISEEAANVIFQNLDRPTAILVGPGLGLSETTRRFLSQLLVENQQDLPDRAPFGEIRVGDHPAVQKLVIDADGLRLLASLPDWPDRLPSNSVLTPHPGEMAALTGIPVADIQADRLGTAEKYARLWGHVVILKGAFTVIASPDGQTAIVPVATPALARAGTGDVLAGLVVGLLAQGVHAFPAAVTAAWIHARAGLRAAAVLGSTSAVLAGDVMRGVVDILADIYADRAIRAGVFGRASPAQTPPISPELRNF